MLYISAILFFLILTVNPSIAFLRLLLSFRFITRTMDSRNRILLFPRFKRIIDNWRCLHSVIGLALNWSSWNAVAVLSCVDCGLSYLFFPIILFCKFLLLKRVLNDFWFLIIWKYIAFVITLNYSVGLAHFLLYVALF